jgi:hypothetical protein
MHTHAHKTQDQAGKSLAREPTHTQEAGSRYHQPMQSMDFHTLAYSSHQVAQPPQAPAAANSYAKGLIPSLQQATATYPIQRMKKVSLITNKKTKKSIWDKGQVKDFKGGTSAGNNGWVGVEKYRARYEVESKDGKFSNSGAIEPLYNNFTNPEAGHALGKQNGGNGMDPKNVFAQDGGTNNSKYKAFENRMRNALNLYDAKDKVTFVCYLAGANIKQGVIADAGMDTASDISSDDDS